MRRTPTPNRTRPRWRTTRTAIPTRCIRPSSPPGTRPTRRRHSTAFRKAATTAGFTLYQASDDGDGITDGAHDGVGYYFYYYYWNRHNDNQLPGTMGTMEFGTVRNNVLQTGRDQHPQAGSPRISDNDPDPTDPEDPDENGDLFITVSVEVLPWVVRENNIEF